MFMAGLGLGSWGAGLFTRRLLVTNGRLALRIYSMTELLIGVSCLAVPIELTFGRELLQKIGSFAGWQSSRYFLVVGVWLAITLIPWCAFMGSTFPMLMAVIRQVARPASERSFSYLYVANVLGALIGTLVSAFVAIELLGFKGTLYVAGCLNAVVALLAFGLSCTISSSCFIDQPAAREEGKLKLYGLPPKMALLLLCTTGLVSMGMEVVWIREFTPYLGNVVYTFAEILAVYLLANVVGSQDYRRWIKTHKPEESTSAWSLLVLFSAIPVIAADPRVSLGPFQLSGVRLASIGMFCCMTGFLTPLLVDSWSSGRSDKAGTAYAVNIAGCIFGPLVAGFLLLPLLGERWALLVLSLPLVAIAAWTAFQKPHESAATKPGLGSKYRFALAIIATMLIFAVGRDVETKYAQREIRRDYTASVVATGTGFHRQLLVNGYGMTVLTPITKYIAHLPLAFMARRPQNGLVICFGMGTSFRSMLTWGIPTTVVELVPSVPKLFGYYHADAQKVVSSPLAHIVIDDGRRFLDGSAQSYDVIVVDPPPPPQAAGSSLLYSREFYEVVKKHLRKDGIFQTWYPAADGDTATTVAITKALVESFPYVRAFYSFDHAGIHYLASMTPIPATSSSELAARMPPEAVADLVEWGPKPTAQQQFELVLSSEQNVGQLIAENPRVPALCDDKPINEYDLLRDRFHLLR